MQKLKERIVSLPTLQVQGKSYLSYQAVTDMVADFLFPSVPTEVIGEDSYRQILETADAICRDLGYTAVERLTPPTVPFGKMGLYWMKMPDDGDEEKLLLPENATFIRPSRIEELQAGRLVDARLSRHGLGEVVRQHFNIPVTVSDGVYELMRRAVEGSWPNDWKGLLHDILGMCISGGKDTGPTTREFTVIIRGVGNRRYYRMEAWLRADELGEPYLVIALAHENPGDVLFELGHVVATAGAATLGVDFTPYLARHAAGHWGELDAFDKRQNDRAVKEGLRILSAYDVPTGEGETERIWIITESNRSVTTVLKPSEY